MKKIAIDNGHGLNTAGKRTPPFPNTGQVIREWQFNHATAKILKGVLEKQGYQAIMVSDTEADTPLMTRINKANNDKCDMLISLHYNAYKSIWGDHGGIETLYNPKSIESKKLAELVQKELIKETKLRDRGAKERADLGVLNYTKMVAILPELGFMDNLDEAKLMLDVDYQTKCANAIARGINAYYGKTNSTTSQENGDEYMVIKTKIKINGETKEIDTINKDGFNYVKLRDLAGDKIVIDYDSAAKIPIVQVK